MENGKYYKLTDRLTDLLDDLLDDTERRHKARKTGSPLGPTLTLSPKLSREIGGSIPLGVSVIHGPPGSGKSALANQLAAEAGCPALVVTCEMRPLVLLRRHAARVTKTFVSKFSSGELSPDVCHTLVSRTIATMPDLAFLDGTRAPVGVGYLRECAEATKGNADHLLIVIDSMHSWVRNLETGDRLEYDVINSALQALQRLTAEIQCSILIIAEQNRANMGSDRQEASAGTRVFEYCAEAVIALSRDREAKPDVDGEIPITATLAKNRHGAAGTTIDLRFCGGFMSFREGDAYASASAYGRRKLSTG